MNYAEQLLVIWGKIHTETPPSHPHDFGVYTETRALTSKEWKLVQEAIKAGYPATIYGHGWMSGVALCVYEPSETIFPGVPVESKPVILIAANQIPGNSPKKSDDEQKFDPGVEHEAPGGVWEIFCKICNTPENLSVLKKEEIDPPKTRGHYQY